MLQPNPAFSDFVRAAALLTGVNPVLHWALLGHAPGAVPSKQLASFGKR